MTANHVSPEEQWVGLLVNAVMALAPEQLRALASAYANDTPLSLPSVQYLQRALSLSTADASQLARSLSQLSGMTSLGSRDVKVALQVLAAARLNDSEAMERVEVVCTTPVQFGLPVRATFATTLEMVQSARETITLVGYVFTGGARELVQQLALAQSSRRVKVTLVGNQMRTHLPVLRALWPHDVPPPRMYSREADPADEMAALHAKLLVCDDVVALVTSANFTYHGLHENIEIGVKVYSKSVARIAEFLDALIAAREVQPIDWKEPNTE